MLQCTAKHLSRIGIWSLSENKKYYLTLNSSEFVPGFNSRGMIPELEKNMRKC